MNNEVMKSNNHEPDYRTAMLYHSDRADAYMAERDAALSEVSRLRARLARMEGALRQLKDNAKGPWVPSSVVGAIVDAALTDGGSNG